jgi:hypothetical protein
MIYLKKITEHYYKIITTDALLLFGFAPLNIGEWTIAKLRFTNNKEPEIIFSSASIYTPDRIAKIQELINFAKEDHADYLNKFS